jgi:hypothetical protein
MIATRHTERTGANDCQFPLKDMRAIVNHLYWEKYENYRETHKLDSNSSKTTSHARGGVDHIFCNIVRVNGTC